MGWLEWVVPIADGMVQTACIKTAKVETSNRTLQQMYTLSLVI